MIAYLDASALVKLCVREEGTALAREIWSQAAARFTSLISYAECRAAIAAAARAERLTPRGADDAAARLEDRWAELAQVRVGARLVRIAGDLAEAHALRGYDAVHLASALAAAEGSALLVATWDQQLARAASDRGLLVTPALG